MKHQPSRAAIKGDCRTVRRRGDRPRYEPGSAWSVYGLICRMNLHGRCRTDYRFEQISKHTNIIWCIYHVLCTPSCTHINSCSHARSSETADGSLWMRFNRGEEMEFITLRLRQIFANSSSMRLKKSSMLFLIGVKDLSAHIFMNEHQVGFGY